MRQNKLIGVTGGIGSGKSSVIAIVKKYYPTVNMDDLTETAYKVGRKKLEETFGKEIFVGDNVDREKLKKKVFGDKTELKKLNEILHPIIIEKTKERANEYDSDVFVECPLLFEAGLSDMFDEVWLVVSEKETKIKRLFERNGYTEEIAKQRINAQMPDEYKIKSSDVIIHNDKGLKELEDEVLLELEKYKNRK